MPTHKSSLMFYLPDDSYSPQYVLGRLLSGYQQYGPTWGQPRRQGRDVEFLPVSIGLDKPVRADELFLARPSPCLGSSDTADFNHPPFFHFWLTLDPTASHSGLGESFPIRFLQFSPTSNLLPVYQPE